MSWGGGPSPARSICRASRRGKVRHAVDEIEEGHLIDLVSKPPAAMRRRHRRARRIPSRRPSGTRAPARPRCDGLSPCPGRVPIRRAWRLAPSLDGDRERRAESWRENVSRHRVCLSTAPSGALTYRYMSTARAAGLFTSGGRSGPGHVGSPMARPARLRCREAGRTSLCRQRAPLYWRPLALIRPSPGSLRKNGPDGLSRTGRGCRTSSRLNERRPGGRPGASGVVPRNG